MDEPLADYLPLFDMLNVRYVLGSAAGKSALAPSLRIVRDAAEIGRPPCWFQPGASSGEVLAEAARLGVPAIDGPCVLIELDARGGRPRPAKAR